MTTTDVGTIVEVSTVVLGDELATDVAAGATSLVVVDAADFQEDGGALSIGTEVIDYTAADDETSTLMLATALASAHTAGERVELSPRSLEKLAQVMVGDSDESVQATVPHALWDRIADGIRDEGQGEVVELELVGTEYVVTNVVGSEPVVDASYMDPATMPESTPTQPTESPATTVEGGVGRLFVRLTPIANASSVAAKIYVGTTTPLPLDASTYHGTATSTLYSITALPDGTPLAYGQTYYVVAVATNEAGDAPPPYAEASGQMRQVTTGDVSAAYVYAGAVTAGQITSGTMDAEVVVGGVIESRGLAGERVGLSAAEGFYSRGPVPAGGTEDQAPIYVHFPVDGKPNIVSGVLEAEKLTVTGGATFRSASSLEPTATFTLEQGVQAPKSAPAYAIGYDTTQHASTAYSDQYGLTKGHDGRWYTAALNPASGQPVVLAFTSAGAVSVAANLTYGYEPLGGMVYASHNGGRYYVLVQSVSDGTWHVEVRDTAMVLITRVAQGTGAVPDFNTGNLPAIGWDHTNGYLLMAYWYTAGASVQVYSRSVDAAGAMTNQAGWISPAGYSYAYDLGYVARHSFDYGAERMVFRRISSASDEAFQVFSTVTSPVQQTANQWPANGVVRGGWWDGTRFYSLNNTGRRTKYEGGRSLWSGTTSARWSLAYTWYDSKAAGTGTHETAQSPRASFTMTKRARVTLTTNAIPVGAGGDDEPDSVRVYWGRGDTDVATTMAREKTLAAGVTTFTFDPAATAEGGSAAAAFGNATPGKAQAAVGGFFVDGNSNGSVGTGTLRDSVDARVSAVAPTVTMTSGAVGTGAFRDSVRTAIVQNDSGDLAAAAPFSGSIRFVRIGNVVFANGNISRASGSSGSFTATGVAIPSWAMPPVTQSLAASPFYNSTLTYRYRLSVEAAAVEIQQSGANTTNMTINATWFV